MVRGHRMLVRPWTAPSHCLLRETTKLRESTSCAIGWPEGRGTIPCRARTHQAAASSTTSCSSSSAPTMAALLMVTMGVQIEEARAWRGRGRGRR